MEKANENGIYLLETASGKVVGTVPLKAAKGLILTADNKLYAISGNRLGLYDLEKKRFQTLLDNLDDPQHLACDKDGNLYVALQGKTMQVWEIAPDGKILQKFGKYGGRPSLGDFDRNGLLKPFDIDVW